MTQSNTVQEQDLEAMVQRGDLDPAAARAGLQLLGSLPTRESWAQFLRLHLLLLGITLLVVGVVFFFAANWSGLSFLAREGLILFALVSAAFWGGSHGIGRLGGRAAIMFAGLLIGPALMVFGQHYQTGADAWELFFGWSLLLLPFVAVARFVGLWLFMALLLNLTWLLFYQAESEAWQFYSETWFHLLSALLYSVMLVLYETGRDQGRAWLQGRWGPRALATIASCWLAIPATKAVLEDGGKAGSLALVNVLLIAAWAFALTWFWRRRWQDLVLLAVGGVLGLYILTLLVARFLFEQDFELLALFLLGGFILIEVGLLAQWLRKQARELEIAA